MRILINENKIVYSVIHDKIYVSNNLSVQSPELLFKLPLSFIEAILYRVPLINRLLRRAIDHLAVIDNTLPQCISLCTLVCIVQIYECSL